VGHTLAEWQAAVAEVIRDEAGEDVRFDQITAAITSALVEHSRAATATFVVEQAGTGSA